MTPGMDRGPEGGQGQILRGLGAPGITPAWQRLPWAVLFGAVVADVSQVGNKCLAKLPLTPCTRNLCVSALSLQIFHAHLAQINLFYPFLTHRVTLCGQRQL